MKYRLALYRSGELIKTISTLPRFSDYDLNANDLRDIITFTLSFLNEYELKKWLFDNSLINKEEASCELAIAFYKNKNSEARRLPFGVPYAPEEKFFDLDFLRLYYGDQLDNPEFMENFFDIYYPKCKDITYLSSINGVYNGYYSDVQDQETQGDTFAALLEFVDKYTTRKDKNGHTVDDFSRLRELAMFAVHNERIRNYSAGIDTIKDLKLRLEHYQNLLQNAITLEEEEAYEHEILKLTREIELKGGY